MSPTKKGPAEELKAQGSPRRLPPPLPNSPRPIKSSLPADATTGMGSNNPFRNRTVDLDTTSGARTDSEASLGRSTGPREAMSPGSEVTPAMGSLTMSYAGATSSRGGPAPPNSAMSSSAKLPSPSKPSSAALGNLIHSPARNSPPSVFHGGKLVINRSADHGRSGSISSLQPSYAEGAAGRKPFHSPVSSTRATLPAEPMVHERGLGLNQSTGAPLPPPYIPSPTGAVIVAEPDSERMDVDHVEVLDPDSALDQISLDDERIENTARFVNKFQPKGGYMAGGSVSSDEDEPDLNKGTVMFSEFDWNRARMRYNTRRANEGCDDPEIGKAPDWRMPVDQPRYTDSPNDERWDYAIGEGISAYTLVQRGPRKHAGHMFKAVLVKEDADGGDPRLKRLVSDLYSCFSNGESYAWWYCYDCCVWFRLGVDYLEDNGLGMADRHNSTISQSSAPPPQSLGGPDVDLARRLREKAGRLCSKHDQQHHFHYLQDILHLNIPPDALLKPRSGSDKIRAEITAEWENIDPRPTCSMYRCCQCDVAVYFDTESAMPACFSERSLTQLKERQPRPGSTIHDEYIRVLSVLFRVITSAIVDQEEEIEDVSNQADGEGPGSKGALSQDDIRIIGQDDIGTELLLRAGFRSKKPDGDRMWFHSLDWEDRQWSLRAWTELKLLIEGHSSTARKNPPPANVASSRFLYVAGSETILQAINRAAAKAMTLEPSALYRLPRWTDPEPLTERRPHPDVIEALVTRLGARWNDTIQQIYDAYLAQVNCHPGGALGYTDVLKILEESNMLDWEEKNVLRLNFSRNPPYSALPSETIPERLRHLDDIVISACPGNPRIDYRSCRHDLLLHLETTVQQEKAWIDGLSDGFDKKDAQENLCRAMTRIAQTLRNPELIHLAEKLRDEFFGLSDVLKKYNVDDPDQVDSDMWPSLYTISLSEANNEDNRNDIIKDFKLIATRLNMETLQRELGMHIDEAATQIPAKPVPAGLYNIGNTCYLNSLLQYLNTVEEFRNAIIALSRLELDIPAKDALPRVGGRLLSQGELVRAKDFVRHLADLFLTLGTAVHSAVAPEKRLAYLALVTATDETQSTEGQCIPQGAAQDSTTTDSPTVEEPLRMDKSVSVDAVTESVLGKRTNDERESEDRVDNEGDRYTPSTEQSEPRTIKAIPISRSGSRSLSAEPIELGQGPAVTSPVRPLSDLVEEAHPPDSTPMDVDESALDTASTVDQALAPLPVGPALRAPPLPPRPHRASINNDMMFGRQHDISECLDNVLFQAEAVAILAVKDEAGIVANNIIKRLFFGVSRQRLLIDQDTQTGSIVKEISAQDVAFNSVYVSVRDEASSDLYEKLQEVYFASDKVDLEGKPAQKVLEMTTIPPVLQIQLERAQFDRETLKPYKSNAYVKFEETLYMDRFLPSADPTKRDLTQKLTRELTNARAKLMTLIGSKQQPIAETMRNLIEALQAVAGGDQAMLGLQANLKVESERIEADIAATKKRIEELLVLIEDQWLDNRECAYELSAVFIHRGQAGFGHYWLYQRDLPDQPDEYLKFNDEIVTRVDKAEVIGDTTGSNANPYLLVYVKKDEHMVRTHMRRARETIQEPSEPDRDQAAPGQAEVKMSVGPVVGDNASHQPLTDTVASRDDGHEIIDVDAAEASHV